MKKLVCLILALILCLSAAACIAEADTSELQKAYDEEMHLARYIVNRGPAWEHNGLMDYEHYWFQVAWAQDKKSNKVEDMENAQEIVDTLKAKREALVQVLDDPESIVWEIWGENMPQAANASEYVYEKTFDEAGFKPFLVPYLLEDQSAVKGNAIIIAGGGFNQRCHDYESYPVALDVNKLGYNAFILQRRVAPSEQIDASLDLQRAVRWLKANAEAKGIGAIDKLWTIGFSGGGMTIMNQLKSCYGDITPDAIYPDYVCDEIDKINSDYAVAAVFYGVITPYESENPNMPKFYVCGGSIDNKVPPKNYLEFYQTAMDNGWAAELYIAYNVHHGFATNGVRAFSDVGYTSATQNLGLLENFLDIEFGYKNATFDSQWHYK